MFRVKKRIVKLDKRAKCEIKRNKFMYGENFVRVRIKQKNMPDRIAYLSYTKQNKNIGKPDNS